MNPLRSTRGTIHRDAVVGALIAAMLGACAFMALRTLHPPRPPAPAFVGPPPLPALVSITHGYGAMATIRHDGHLFVVFGPGGILHHPDCPCLTTQPTHP